MSVWLLAVVAQSVTVGQAAEAASAALVTAAAASPRPTECGVPAGELQTLWQRARSPRLVAYCDALARGYARLDRAPEQALQAAELAARTLPDRIAPRVLQGRALLALGRHDQALRSLLEARERSSRSVEAPGALHDLGVAALLAGRPETALAAYRALVPRAGLIADDLRRQNVYIEAAAVVMQSGAQGLDEAIGYLGEARRRGSPPGTRDIVLASLALALDRQGRVDEARGVIAEASGPYLLAQLAAEQRGEEPATPSDAPADSAKADARPAHAAKRHRAAPVLPAGELDAMVAILAEPADRDVAREHWRAALTAAAQGPWADHARRHVAALEGGRRPRGAGR
jgi:tetratricopeptide (TPR) repeat protein